MCPVGDYSLERRRVPQKIKKASGDPVLREKAEIPPVSGQFPPMTIQALIAVSWDKPP